MPIFHIRVTKEELSLWKRLAKHRQSFHKKQPGIFSVSTMIRQGLNKIINSVCLCEPGHPTCPHCTNKNVRT